MGHSETVQVLHTHYKELVDYEAARTFFHLIPRAIVQLDDHNAEKIKGEEIN
jgi:hypothetical protein